MRSFFNLFIKNLFCNESTEFKVFISNTSTGISSYELRFHLSTISVAKIDKGLTPSWAKDVYSISFNDSARLKAIDIENKVQNMGKIFVARIKIDACRRVSRRYLRM